MAAFARVIDDHPFWFVFGAVLVTAAVIEGVTRAPPEVAIPAFIKAGSALVLANIMGYALKIITESSWPSVHMACATALCTVASFYAVWLVPVFGLLLFMTAVGRMLLDRHVPIDIAGGFFLGLSVALLMEVIFVVSPG